MTTIVSLTALPDPPSRTDTAATFEAAVDTYLEALNVLTDEINQMIDDINGEVTLSTASILTTTFSMSTTSLALESSIAYSITLSGVVSTSKIFVTPVEWSTESKPRAQVHYSAYYTAADTVRVLVQNASDESVTLTAGTWRITAIN